MDSVRAYRDDVDRQVAAADSFVPPQPLPARIIRNAVFVGSGDSLAAAMLAEAFSDLAARAADPLEACRNPRMTDGRAVYVVSVSGRTVTNVRLAKTVPCTAITSQPDSPLAEAASDVIPLEFPNSDELTAGSISFLNSALVCISLVRPVSLRVVGGLYERARRDAARADAGGRTFFVGNQHTYPVAMYAAAKMYEILGSDAHYSRLEQFSHMELFCAKPGDRVVLFADADGHTKSLAASLEPQGIRCTITDPRLDALHSVVYHTFYAQMLPLNLVRGREVHFIEAARLKDASDSMIY